METNIPTTEHIGNLMHTAELLKQARTLINCEYRAWKAQHGADESPEILMADNMINDAINEFSRHIGRVSLYQMMN